MTHERRDRGRTKRNRPPASPSGTPRATRIRCRSGRGCAGMNEDDTDACAAGIGLKGRPETCCPLRPTSAPPIHPLAGRVRVLNDQNAYVAQQGAETAARSGQVAQLECDAHVRRSRSRPTAAAQQVGLGRSTVYRELQSAGGGSARAAGVMPEEVLWMLDDASRQTGRPPTGCCTLSEARTTRCGATRSYGNRVIEIAIFSANS
jgi:hypothetical protein